jgi:hypothetical protein
MDIKFDVKRKYVVNGKEYGSLEEMPAAMREVYEKAVGKAHGAEHGNISSISSDKIVFNGQEYDSVNAIPPDVRQMYETIMNAVKGEKGVPMEKSGFQIGFNVPGIKDKGILATRGINSKPIEPKSGFSPRVLIIAGAIIMFIIGLYILMSIGGSR